MRKPRLTRAQQQAMTRERLLVAAARAIDRYGFRGASIDLITAEAGYSKGAIYSNFESKEAVFLELLRVYMERDTAAFERILDLNPDELFAAVTHWLETMDTETDCPLLVTELSWPSAYGKTSKTYGIEVTEQGQADRLRKALPLLAARRRALRIEAVYWYTWLTADSRGDYPFDYAGASTLSTGRSAASSPRRSQHRSGSSSTSGCRVTSRTRAWRRSRAPRSRRCSRTCAPCPPG